MRLKFIFLLILAVILGDLACTSDKLDQPISNCNNQFPAYIGDVKAIIDISCAYSGCHVNGSSAPGNFSTYEGLSRNLSNGSFEDRVFNIKDDPVQGMPPDNSPGPRDLSAAQLDILRCWMEGGYLEN